MKQILCSILLILSLAISFTACSLPDGVSVCQHRDVNDDSKCDKCAELYTDGKDIQDPPTCQHTNADKNGICDTCGTICSQMIEIPDTPTDGIAYEISSDGTYAKVVEYRGTASTVLIADIYNGLPVTTIGEYAFYTPDVLQIIIPDSVTTIEAYAFSECILLESIIMGKSLTTIKECAFDLCVSLKNVYIRDLAAWCNISFYDLFSNPISQADNVYLLSDKKAELITDLLIPEGVKEIREYSFVFYDALKSIAFPNSVTSIGDAAFSGCKALTSIYIPDSITWIGYNAFIGCTSLTSVSIGNSVTYIGRDAFSICHPSLYKEYEGGVYVGNAENPYAILIKLNNKQLNTYTLHPTTQYVELGVFEACTELKTITLPDALKAIGLNAFFGLNSLSNIIIGKAVTSINDRAFCGCSDLSAVYYKGNADDWSKISISQNSNDDLLNTTRYYYSEAFPTEAGNYWHYDESGAIAIWN